jgi:regulator of replication initiation timing
MAEEKAKAPTAAQLKKELDKAYESNKKLQSDIAEVLSENVALKEQVEALNNRQCALCGGRGEGLSIDELIAENEALKETLETLGKALEEQAAELAAQNEVKEVREVFTGAYKAKNGLIYSFRAGFKLINVPGFMNNPHKAEDVISNAAMMEKLISIRFGGLKKLSNN